MNKTKLSTIKINKVYHRLFINQCYICKAKSDQPLCQFCEIGFPKNRPSCQICRRPLSTEHAFICGQCQASPPTYQQCFAPLRFEGITKNLIHRIKFHQLAYYARPLAHILSQHLLEQYAASNRPWPEQLIYVPSHTKRIKQRGFCHTQIIASLVHSLLEKELENKAPKLPKHNPLSKTIHTDAQHMLDRKSRLKTPQGTYLAEGKIPPHVALIDDVLTTGSTIEACAKTLKKSGAKQIDVWVIARTPDKMDV